MSAILCIGEALIDMICTDRGRALSEGEHFLKKPGGAPTNVAAAIAALGGKASLVAKVGADPFGQHLTDVMNEFGVDTRHLISDPSCFTTFAFVSLLENGERDFYFNRGADGKLSSAETASINLNDFSIVHFGSATAFLPGPLQQAYKNLLAQSLEKNLFVSFDPNYRHLLFRDEQPSFIEQSWYFIKACHFFKVSDEEALLLTGAATVTDAAAKFFAETKAVFAITLGKEGTLFGGDGQTQVIPSIAINPVDTTGAGDAFVGAVLYQLSNFDTASRQQLSPAQWAAIISNGNLAGARTCEYMGAMEAFKHLSSNIFNG